MSIANALALTATVALLVSCVAELDDSEVCGHRVSPWVLGVAIALGVAAIWTEALT